MWQKSFLAGGALVGTLLKISELQKSQMQQVLAGDLVLVVLLIQLHMGIIMDDNGLRILDWNALVSSASFHVMRHFVAAPLDEAGKETDEKNYLLWRIENGVAAGSSEIPKGEAIPLEYSLAGLNAISFDKGCYVDQELIARTHHGGVIRKRLLPLMFLDENKKEVEQKVAPGSEVIDTTSGKMVGSVTSLVCRGLGLLQLEEALKGG